MMPMAKLPFCDGLVLLHNPRCSKSRGAVALLAERGVAAEIRLYLEQPLSLDELREVWRRLGVPVREWTRRQEEAYTAAGLGATSTDEDLLAAMAAHPSLMERPILITPTGAVVGRPPELILPLLES